MFQTGAVTRQRQTVSLLAEQLCPCVSVIGGVELSDEPWGKTVFTTPFVVFPIDAFLSQEMLCGSLFFPF